MTSGIFFLMILAFCLHHSASSQNGTHFVNVQSERPRLGINNSTNAGHRMMEINNTEERTTVESAEELLYKNKDTFQQAYTKIHRSLLKYVLLPLRSLSLFFGIITIIVLQKGSLRSSSTVYIRGFTLADTIISLLGIIYILDFYHGIKGSLTWKIFYSYIVVYGDEFYYVAITANVWIILALASERMFAIFYPMKARVFNNEFRALQIVIGIFLAAVVINIPRFLRMAIVVDIEPETNLTIYSYSYTELGSNPSFTYGINMSFAVLVVIIPIPILAVLNILIMVRLRRAHRQQRQLKEGNAATESDSNGQNTQRQIERVLVASICSILCCFTLTATTVLTVAFEGTAIFRTFIFEVRLRFLISGLIQSINPLINFILYVLCSKILRDDVKTLFCFLCK